MKSGKSRLAKARGANGFTQSQVAQKLNVNTSTISRWEQDDRAIRAKDLIRLAKLYECSIDDLVSESFNSK